MKTEDIMMSFKDNGLAEGFLSDDDIRKKCPCAFMTEPSNPDVSTLYVQANTKTVIDDMAKLGWYPVDAKQQRQRGDRRYSFHMVAFQNPDVVVRNIDGGVDCWPRIILTNSHDGMHAFKFMVGLYRVVCSNGLVIASDQFADLSIRHVAYTFQELRDLTANVIAQLPKQIEIINGMKRVVLNKRQKIELASAAFKIRRGIKPEVPFMLPFDVAEEIIKPFRNEDNGDDLWTVYNVLQEKMTRGGFKVSVDPEKKPRKIRAIKAVAKDLDMNKKLFKLAAGYVPAGESGENGTNENNE